MTATTQKLALTTALQDISAFKQGREYAVSGADGTEGVIEGASAAGDTSFVTLAKWGPNQKSAVFALPTDACLFAKYRITNGATPVAAFLAEVYAAI